MRAPGVAMALLALGCGEPVGLTVLSAKPIPDADEKLVLELQTEAEATVSCAEQREEVVAGADGKVEVEVDLFHTRTGPQDVNCYAKKRGMLGQRRGHTSHPVVVPVHVRSKPEKANELECGNEHKCAGHYSWTEQLELVFTDLPKDTVVELGTTKVTCENGWLFEVKTPFDLTAELPDAKLSDILHDGPPLVARVPFQLTFPDGLVAKTAIRGGGEAYRAALGRELRKLEKGALRFPGETAQAGSGSLLAIGDVPTAQLFGSAERVRDLARVALLIEVKRERSCGSFQATTAEGVPAGAREVFLEHRDLRVRVYDRRTGAKLGEKTFPAPPKSCPGSFVDGREVDATISKADPKPAFEWAASFVN